MLQAMKESSKTGPNFTIQKKSDNVSFAKPVTITLLEKTKSTISSNMKTNSTNSNVYIEIDI